MITEINNPKETRHYLAHDGKDVFHYGILEPGQYLITGQPFFEDVVTEEEWIAKAEVLGIISAKEEDIALIPEEKASSMSYQTRMVEAKKMAVEKVALEAANIIGEFKK